MRITHRIAKPLSGKIAILLGTGILILSLLTLSLLLTRTSHAAFALANKLHPFTITSPNFRDGGPISQRNEINRFGCTGSNISPELNWKNVPAGTKSFVMLMSNYDARLPGASTTGLSTSSLPVRVNWKGITPSRKEQPASASLDTVGLVHHPQGRLITTSSYSMQSILRMSANKDSISVML